jgi:hypothetical protein
MSLLQPTNQPSHGDMSDEDDRGGNLVTGNAADGRAIVSELRSSQLAAWIIVPSISLCRMIAIVVCLASVRTIF